MNLQQSFIHPDAKIGKNVSIGPFCYIGADVVIGDHCKIESHVVIKGPCIIGTHNHFYQFGSIGEDCQDKKYAGEPTQLIIGDHNVFRESVTVHRGTVQDKGITQIGSHNLFMAYVHVAHDCTIGHHVIMSNNASVAGHCEVHDWAIIAGMVGVHQHVRIGAHSFIAGGSMVRKDIPPFIMAEGASSAAPKGLNSEGMKRRDYSSESIMAMKKAYRKFYRDGLTKDDALAELKHTLYQHEAIQQFVDFISCSERGVIR